jgi:hypothetical protein
MIIFKLMNLVALHFDTTQCVCHVTKPVFASRVTWDLRLTVHFQKKPRIQRRNSLYLLPQQSLQKLLL